MGATALEAYANDYETTLAAAISSTTTTSITVASATGMPGAGNFRVRIDDEIMLVTAGHGTTTWTVRRGQEGSSAATHSSGASVVHVLTAAGVLNSPLPSTGWTHGGTLHYTGSSSAASPNVATPSAYYSTYNQYLAQPFVLNNSGGVDISRVVLYVKSSTSNAAADVTVSVQTNGASGPSGTRAGGSPLITLPGEFFTTTARAVSIPLRCTGLAVNNTTTYWIVVGYQFTDATNYLQVGYTASTPSVRTSTNGSTWTDSATNKLCFDVLSGASGSLINTTEEGTASATNAALVAGANWTELVYDTGGNLSTLYEYRGSFRNSRTLSYDSTTGALTGVA